MKTCSKCEVTKEDSEYNPLRNCCNACLCIYNKKYQKKFNIYSKSLNFKIQSSPTKLLKEMKVSQISKEEFNKIRMKFGITAKALKNTMKNLQIELVNEPGLHSSN